MCSPRPEQAPDSGNPAGFDSRAWTGPELEPPSLDGKRARAAFRAAGGPVAMRPQRLSSAIAWICLAAILAFALLGPPDVDPWPLPFSWPDEARDLLGFERAAGPVPVLSDPVVLVLASTLLAAWAGILTAFACRHALARGFRAAEADRDGAVFVTHRVDLLALAIGFMFLVPPAEGRSLSLPALLTLEFLAIVTVRAMTAVAERRVAGLGARSPDASRWDVAALAASSLVLAMAMVRALAT